MKLSLIKIIFQVNNKGHLLGRASSACSLHGFRCKTTSNKNENDDDELDKPYKYSTSEAARWAAVASRNPYHYKNDFEYEHTVVTLSIAVFLIYFCILREENDIDIMLTEQTFDLNVKPKVDNK